MFGVFLCLVVVVFVFVFFVFFRGGGGGEKGDCHIFFTSLVD